MTTSITELLARLTGGGSSLQEACAEAQAIARAATQSDVTQCMTQIRTEAAAGRLGEADATALLHALETLAAETLVMSEKTRPFKDESTDKDDEPTELDAVRGPANAGSAAAGGTLVRSLREALEEDTRPQGSNVADPVETKEHSVSATLRDARGANEHTVREHDASAKRAGAEHATTFQANKTEVIASRRVQSLADVSETAQGPLQPGSVIKQRFVLDTLLGKGGMGLVFGAVDRRKEEARDPQPRVALKVLNADFKRHPQSLIALQREARKAQTLAHPNVVTVFDFDRDGEVVYMTMELLKGRSLESMVREKRGSGIGAAAALSIIRGIAEGLAYAHRKGIVHSDLKPANVFICEDGTPKILDFGIARAVPSSIADDVEDEFDASMLGAYTEAYATDEMVEGFDAHPADDMYALGIIAYELLTGFHPYKRHSAPNARELGISPEPLRGLKRKEAKAIHSCLSFDRQARPQDAGEFLKLFRGVTRLQKATLAAAAVLALVAGYASYQTYVETSPAIAFSELSLARQDEFRDLMDQGDKAWVFFERDLISDGLFSAIDLYARAYRIHPRNREAVAALNEAAEALLDAARSEEQRREYARYLQAQSDHYRKYAPVVEAAK